MKPAELAGLLSLGRRSAPHGPRLKGVADLDDFRELARRRLPRTVFDFIDGGADGEVSLRRNRAALERLTLLPRTMRDVSSPDPSVSLLGSTLPFPVVLAPTGFVAVAHSDAEIGVARAAAGAEVPFTVPTMATRSLERVADAAAGGELWFQLYPWRDRGVVRNLLARAASAGYRVLVVSVDVPVSGNRVRDTRKGMTMPPRIGWSAVLEGLRRPRWTADFLRAEPLTFANVETTRGSATDTMTFVARQFDPGFDLEALAWIRSIWTGPMLVKGVLRPDDAVAALDAGADGVVVSNHGGRQLDLVPAPIDALPAVVAAVAGRGAVLVDSGFRRGAEVLVARALGADAVMIGRPYLFGLAAAGSAGVTAVLEILKAEVERSMALVGVRTMAQVGPDLLF